METEQQETEPETTEADRVLWDEPDPEGVFGGFKYRLQPTTRPTTTSVAKDLQEHLERLP